MLTGCGAEYNKAKRRQKGYCDALLEELPQLKMNRGALDWFQTLPAAMGACPGPGTRSCRSGWGCRQTIGGVGPVLALTWVLELGQVGRLGSIRKAGSFCGLCSGESQSGDPRYRTPWSEQRNKYLQSELIEAAKVAVRWNAPLREVDERAWANGHRTLATLAVAR